MKPRNPALAGALNFISPGLGHLYLGRVGLAFLVAALFRLAIPAWVALWAFLRFSPKWLALGTLLLDPSFRLAAAIWAVLKGRSMGEFALQKWQRGLTYATFFMVSAITGMNLDLFVHRHFARPYQVTQASLAPKIQPGDGVWLVRTRDARLPQRGAMAAFDRKVARDKPILVVVRGRGGDKVEVGVDGTFVNGEKVAGAAAANPMPEVILREGQIFGIAPGRNPTEGALDSRDVGPLTVGDYLGEIAVLDPLSQRRLIPGLHAHWLEREKL